MKCPSGASRLVEAMVWIDKIESAKSVAELKTSVITGPSCRQTSRFLILKKARGSTVTSNQEENCTQRETLSHGMAIRKSMSISRSRDTDESVLDLNENLRVELKNDNVQSFNTRWDETIIATKKQPEKGILDNLFYRQFQQLEHLKPLLSLFIPDRVHESESGGYSRLSNIVIRYLKQNIREKHFSFRDKGNVGDHIQWKSKSVE